MKNYPYIAGKIRVPELKRELLSKDMHFSVRLLNILLANGYTKLGDLVGVPYSKILELRNCGIGTVSELSDFILSINEGTGHPVSPEGGPKVSESILQDKTISIPEGVRGRLIRSEPLSARLKNYLTNMGIQLTGDLHGRRYQNIIAAPNFGDKTLFELEAFVSYLQGAAASQYSEEIICIPAKHHDIDLRELPLSARLFNVLLNRGMEKLGDLQGVRYDRIYKERNFGQKCKDELADLVKSLQSETAPILGISLKSLIISGLFPRIDALASGITERERNILLMRFAGNGGKTYTLEEIGQVHSLTRERVRQIIDKKLTRMRRTLRIQCQSIVGNVERLCEQKVFPITPDIVSGWLSEGDAKTDFPQIFYLRLIREMFPDIPVWVNSLRYDRNNDHLDKVIGQIRKLTADCISPIGLGDLYGQVKENKTHKNLKIGEYFRALESCPFLRIDLSSPDSGTVLNNNVNRRYWVNAVLEKSDIPLTPEQILDEISKAGAANVTLPSPGTLSNSLLPENGFYLLDRRAFGLRKHFRLPENLWKQVRADCHQLLKREGRPTSATEIVSKKLFEWTESTNAYELAQILREDRKFLDLGRFLFALSIWGIEEREHIHDLLPGILSGNNQPMHVAAVSEKLGRLRSASPTSLSASLRKDQRVQDYGFGYYGLKEWGSTKNNFLVNESMLVDRIVRRADPPFRFGELCDVMKVGKDDSLIQQLWKTVKSLRKVEVQDSPIIFETEVRHQSWRLEKAISQVLENTRKPLLPYEIKWELNDRFGFAFMNRTESDIHRCLKLNPLFIKDQKGAYLLNKQIDYYELDIVNIKKGVFDILKSKNEIVGCDDLLERLESSGIDVEKLSPSMLAALLRSFDAFEEVGINRFRIIKWKQ